ncbi:hypothetical protein CCACVL1_00080 [Corchorus capsularis]|uniref:Uncharacterized protein n=1 Tax=Corchorus capsularis TaxID=210143 RepID=A0A1R3KYK9_COCAP|nr:hypothetical protein CCACVL1_00080 [Corchorus capsularis]
MAESQCVIGVAESINIKVKTLLAWGRRCGVS